jgi:ACS family tartrate transporter-like MFS transporter
VIGWLKNVTGSYSAGLYVVAATLAVSAIVTLMLSRQAKPPRPAAHERHSH